MTATQASRSFSALLREIQSGQSVVITWGGREVAVMSPVTTGNGAAVLAALAASPVDEDFSADVQVARASMDEQSPAWLDD